MKYRTNKRRKQKMSNRVKCQKTVNLSLDIRIPDQEHWRKSKQIFTNRSMRRVRLLEIEN